MNINDAFTQAAKQNGTAAEYQLAGAVMIADAINRLAAAQERQAEIQEKQWELASGMMDKMAPMVDKTVKMMDTAIDEHNEGEAWKRRNSLDQGDDEEDNGS